VPALPLPDGLKQFLLYSEERPVSGGQDVGEDQSIIYELSDEDEEVYDGYSTTSSSESDDEDEVLYYI
jgi:hypothetical protein